MSTEFYLHAELAELPESEAQKFKIRQYLHVQWRFATELFSKEEVSPYPKKEPQLACETELDYIHVGHVAVCEEMQGLISSLPGLLIDDALIEVLLSLLKVSWRRLHFLRDRDKPNDIWYYPSVEEDKFKDWLISNKGKRLFERVD